MAFLVETDSKERFPISTGESVIGRGPYLRVKELSLSRSHAVLSYSDGKLQIKPLHKNPTFYYPSANSPVKENQQEILEKDEWKILVDGDEISLLADSYRYHIELKEPAEEEEKSEYGTETPDNIEGDKDDDIKSLVEDNQKIKTDNDLSDNVKTSMDDDQAQNKSPSVSTSPKKRTLPSWIDDSGNSPQKKKVNREKKISPQKDKIDSSYIDQDESTNISGDKEHLEQINSDGNKVDKTLDDEVQCSTSASNVCNSPPQSDNNEEDAKESEEEKEESLKKCPYGRKCYRKNPMHFKEFTHPGENDYDEDEKNESENEDGEKTECPYGLKCYRQNNPHHTAKHTHTTIGKERTSRRKRKTRTKKGKSLLDKEEDADGENEYDMNDSFLASSDESSGYSDDPDDSDYDPRSGKYEEEEEEEEEEDLDELVAEAKGFIKNKKM